MASARLACHSPTSVPGRGGGRAASLEKGPGSGVVPRLVPGALFEDYFCSGPLQPRVAAESIFGVSHSSQAV